MHKFELLARTQMPGESFQVARSGSDRLNAVVQALQCGKDLARCVCVCGYI